MVGGGNGYPANDKQARAGRTKERKDMNPQAAWDAGCLPVHRALKAVPNESMRRGGRRSLSRRRAPQGPAALDDHHQFLSFLP